MDSQIFGTIVRRLREATAPVADADLVRAFANDQDSTAFAEVVRRHGPMVLGVCRRVLSDSADADDAFQATFLVLIRKAGTLKQADRLAGWLHQVAMRTARKLRAIRTARRGREVELLDVPTREATADFIWRELRPIFDEELDRLPDRLRLPAVLCFLEGCSKSEAARTLGWPEGTLSGRLQRAREWLRARFTARGLTLSSGALAVALFDAVESAAVSERLIESTIQHATLGPAISAGVRTLAEGVTQAMFMSKVKTIAAGVLVMGIIGTGTGFVLVPGAGPERVAASEPAKEAAPKKKEPKPAVIDETIERLDRLRKEGRSQSFAEVIAVAEGEMKRLGRDPADAIECLNRLQELLILKERLSWQERMVKKGFMTETELKKTKLDIARVEIELAKLKEPPKPDPRVTAYETTVQKLEEIVRKTEEGVKRGVVPEIELLNSQLTLNRYRLQLLEIKDQPKQGTLKPDDPRRVAMEELIKKMEEIVEKTAEGVRKGIIPQQELLNAERVVLEYKFKLVELSASPLATESTDASLPSMRKAEIEIAEKNLARAESLLMQKVIAQAEVRRLRIDLARLRAENANIQDDYAAALKYHETVTSEMEAVLATTKALVEQRTATRAELRKVEASLAEAKVAAMQAAIRKQLADVVAIREQDLKEARTLFDVKTISANDLRNAERALAVAKARLAAGR